MSLPHSRGAANTLVLRHDVLPQTLLCAEPDAAVPAEGLAAMPGQVLAPPRLVGQDLATARPGTGEPATCRNNGPG